MWPDMPLYALEMEEIGLGVLEKTPMLGLRHTQWLAPLLPLSQDTLSNIAMPLGQKER